jgi:hypothetical protein
MMWHVVFAEPGRLPQSRAAKSRDRAIQAACELLSQSLDVRRILEPNGRSIERPELDEHFDEGRFPGLRRNASSIGGETLAAATAPLSVHQPHGFRPPVNDRQHQIPFLRRKHRDRPRDSHIGEPLQAVDILA